MVAAATPAVDHLRWLRTACNAVSGWMQRVLSDRVRRAREVVSDWLHQLRDCIAPQTSVEEHGDPSPSEMVVWNY